MYVNYVPKIGYDYMVKFRKNGDIIIRHYDDMILVNDKNFERVDINDEFVQSMDSLEKVLYQKRLREIKNSFIDLENHNDTDTLKEIRKDSLSRTRNFLIDYALENSDKFNTFLTLTFSNDITDVKEANKLLNIFLTQWRRKLKKEGRELYYLGVPEFQKKGRVHYHLLTSLDNDRDIPRKELLKTYNKNKGKEYEHYYYDIPFWKYGYSDSFDIIKDTDDNFDLSLYLLKYLYKDIDNRLYGSKKLLKSNNLISPSVYKVNSNDSNTNIFLNRLYQFLEYKKIEIADISRIELKTHTGQPLKYDNIYIKSQHYNTILESVLKDNLEF